MSTPERPSGARSAPGSFSSDTHADPTLHVPDLQTFDPRVLDALTGRDAGAERAVALKTRRAVYHAVMNQRSERDQSRRNLLFALLLTGALTLALAPALWAGIDDLLGGETLLDLPGMLVALGMTLFAAVAAVLFLLGGERRAPHAARSGRR